MNRCLLLPLSLLALLVPVIVQAETYLPAPVVNVVCDRDQQTVITVRTVPNLNYVFHFRKAPPLPQALDLPRRTTSTATTFTGFVRGSWTLSYNIPAKGSMSRAFTVPDCRRPPFGTDTRIENPRPSER